jgi:hypothetical protein
MNTDSVKTKGIRLTILIPVLKNPVRTSTINSIMTLTKLDRLMLLKEMFPFYFENHNMAEGKVVSLCY